MASTTIKVDTTVRDRLTAQARHEGTTVGRILVSMLEGRERAQRFADIRSAIASTTPEDMASYREETEEWESTSSDGLVDW